MPVAAVLPLGEAIIALTASQRRQMANKIPKNCVGEMMPDLFI